MSTRAEIIIKDYGIYKDKKWSEKVKLYHHHDGYPEYLGKFLVENVLIDLRNHPSVTISEIANDLIKHEEDTEFELTLGTHIDIEYQYVIDIPSKRILCYSGHYREVKPDTYRFKIYKKIDLEKYLPLESEAMYN